MQPINPTPQHFFRQYSFCGQQAIVGMLLYVFAIIFIANTIHAQPLNLPYKQAGFTEKQAAAYILDRFSFGAKAGDEKNSVESVAKQGVAQWFEEQLQSALPEAELERRLADFKSLKMTTKDIATTYPNPGMILAQAKRDGMDIRKGDSISKDEYRGKLREYAESKGIRPQREMLGEMYAQKLLRAVYAQNQLSEVLTDFWFNHFNVAITDNQARPFVMTYERDAIRPFVLGTFRQMLGATAKHPAMLQYLDNAQSTAPEGTQTTSSAKFDDMKSNAGPVKRAAIEKMQTRAEQVKDSMMKDIPDDFKPRKGINENYARELMELHTLGVDGGYAQKDVTEAARVLTGWTIFPMGQRGDKLAERLEKGKAVGFVREGVFLFRADAHDATEKNVLGTAFPKGGGMEEGERLLDMLVKHPSTAKFLATKIARRFVSDNPPQALVARLAEAFTKTGGDMKALIRTIVESPEFWSKDIAFARVKIKSPFELTVSALRAVNADVERPRAVLEWVTKIGQPLYAYQAPTGFPDRAENWINTGSLLNRMNFGLALALGKIKGVSFNLAALNNNHEPESAEDALTIYAALLMPERNLTETIRLLKPMVANATSDPAFADKVNKAASDAEPTQNQQKQEMMPPERQSMKNKSDRFEAPPELDDRAVVAGKATNMPANSMNTSTMNTSTVAQVVGIILGSPEFQRR